MGKNFENVWEEIIGKFLSISSSEQETAIYSTLICTLFFHLHKYIGYYIASFLMLTLYYVHNVMSSNDLFNKKC